MQELRETLNFCAERDIALLYENLELEEKEKNR